MIHCPFCHGYEVRDQRVVQIVTHPAGLHPTALVRHLTDRLTVVLHEADGVDEATVEALRAAGVVIERDEVARVVAGRDGAPVAVELAGGGILDADALLVGPRFRARAEVLDGLGVRPTAHPMGLGNYLEVDQTGQTSVPGLYGAGNLTDPSLQVLPAAAHGSRVGAMTAFGLAEEDLQGPRRSGDAADWEQRYDGGTMWSANPNGTLVAEAGPLQPGRALDVGAGEGADALWLAEHGWEVTASDISGNALARLADEAHRRGLDVRRLRADANAPAAFSAETYDLVSLQYGSFHRTPDRRGLHNLLDAVAPGGTLLVVGHDHAPLREPVDVATQTRIFDPEAYVGVDEVAAALADDGGWHVDVHETRPRPAGAASTHHVHDVVLRATRTMA